MFKKIILISIIFLSFTQQAVRADMDPKVKALGTMAVYGTVGGAMLGTAALAFDAKGRSVAIGASLGLYLGLIFGGYVVGSHAIKKRRNTNEIKEENYYPDTESSPYETPAAGSAYPVDDQVLYESGPSQQHVKNEVKFGPVYYMPILNYQF